MSLPTAPTSPLSIPDLGAGSAGPALEPHPVGRVRHGLFAQALRAFAFVSWLTVSVLSIHLTQWLGTPLYFLSDRHYYYSYMTYTKRSFGILVTTLTQWFSPTTIRVSGDRSVRGQLQQSKDGRLVCKFAPRAVVMANHQLYSDWLYLWWIAYTNSVHGNIYIILKESLKYIPVIGPGMMFYGFVFMARNWLKDQPRLKHRLGKLAGNDKRAPMWLLIFPEGTNLSGNTRKGSRQWAEKSGIQDLEHLLLPRSTGLGFCLRELGESVEWIYDCTVAYEGIPRGAYGQDIFTLRSNVFQGRPPKSVNMYWRRFPVSSIPVPSSNPNDKAFSDWLLDRWKEKEALLEGYAQNGRFPADEGHDSEGEPGQGMSKGAGFIETEVMLRHWYDVVQIFGVFLVVAGMLYAFLSFLRFSKRWA